MRKIFDAKRKTEFLYIMYFMYYNISISIIELSYPRAYYKRVHRNNLKIKFYMHDKRVQDQNVGKFSRNSVNLKKFLSKKFKKNYENQEKYNEN